MPSFSDVEPLCLRYMTAEETAAVMQHAAMLIIVQQSTQKLYEVIYGDKGEAEETFLCLDMQLALL